MTKERGKSIVFLADKDRESREARKLLDELGMEYKEIPSSGAGVPCVVFGSLWFSTLDGVKEIVTALDRSND